MNTKEIELLLEKFYEGNTTLQEEKTLHEFFRSENVPDHLTSHQPLFTYFADEQHSVIGDQDFELTLTAHFTENEADRSSIFLRANRFSLRYITSIAASILLLIGLMFTLRNDLFKRSSTMTGDLKREIVYADAREALLLVSGNLNNGLKQIERLQMVDKAMKNIQIFNKFYQYQTIIINPDEIYNKSIKSK
jgi:hypothetical protein